MTKQIPPHYKEISFGSLVDGVSAMGGVWRGDGKRVCPDPQCKAEITDEDANVAHLISRICAFQPKSERDDGKHAVLILCGGRDGCNKRIGFSVGDEFVQALREMGESRFFRSP